jgi:hypothetical protein
MERIFSWAGQTTGAQAAFIRLHERKKYAKIYLSGSFRCVRLSDRPGEAVMDRIPNIDARIASGSLLTTDVEQPMLVEKDGQPFAVLMSIPEFERYQALLANTQFLSAMEARRAADHVVFGDLVGCALSSDEPLWSPEPQPHWRVPYRLFDGRLLAIIHVDAQTAVVALSDHERDALLDKLESLLSIPYATA